MSNELNFLEILRKELKQPDITLPIGDDAAVFNNYIITTDAMVENIHFTSKASINNIIFKLFTSNVSDIAAMGGTPLYSLLSLSIPKGKFSQKELIDAIKYAINKYGIYLIGGDTTSSMKDAFFSATIIGKKRANLLTRKSARPGDLLYLSRQTGLAQVSLEKEIHNKPFDIDTFFHYNILAEKELGELLGKTDCVNACIDISDGMGIDLMHIASESKVKIVVEANKLPINHLKKYNIDPIKYAINSGEEYALIFTSPYNKNEKLINIIKEKLNRNIYNIGYIEEGFGVQLKYNNKFIDISSKGYIHNI